VGVSSARLRSFTQARNQSLRSFKGADDSNLAFPYKDVPPIIIMLLREANQLAGVE
jgi:hypothetical protein